jgi:hypothetical protein
MSLPKIIYSDLSQVIYSGSEVASTDYPFDNLTDYMPTSRWVSSTTTADQFLYMDFGTAYYANSIVIENHNLDSIMSDGNVYLEAASTSSFSGSSYVNIIPITTDTNAIYFNTFDLTYRRYYRLRYSGSLSDTPYIGNIFIGRYFQFPYTYQWGYKKYNKEFNTTEKTALDGTIKTHQNCDGRTKYEVTWKYLDNSTKDNFITFVNTVNGKLYPFYFVDHCDIVSYMLLESDYNPTVAQRYNLNDLQTVIMKSQYTALTYDEVVTSEDILRLYDVDFVTEV